MVDQKLEVLVGDIGFWNHPHNIQILGFVYENRLKFYNDPIPHRHKYRGTGDNPNIPLYFIWVDKGGKEHRLTYIESRQFYCNFYERFALESKDFLYIKSLVMSGVNIQICGYDAAPLVGSIEEEYLNPRVPFGHERVLYTLLMVPPEEYPWRKYKTFEF